MYHVFVYENLYLLQVFIWSCSSARSLILMTIRDLIITCWIFTSQMWIAFKKCSQFQQVFYCRMTSINGILFNCPAVLHEVYHIFATRNPFKNEHFWSFGTVGKVGVRERDTFERDTSEKDIIYTILESCTMRILA